MEWWAKLIYVFVGCSGAVVFTPNAPTAMPFFKRLFPSRPVEEYERISALFVLIISTVLAYVYDPPDPLKAMLTGLGAVALLKQTLQSFGPQQKLKPEQHKVKPSTMKGRLRQ
jgi:TctA family transporter